jgi:CRP-like cAMP-binding protein
MPKPTTAQRVEALRQIPLFRDLSQKSLRAILACANEVDVPAGQVLVQPGLEGSGLFVIEEGSVMVELPNRKAELGPGECFGELALLTPEAVRTARVRTRTDVRCLAISRYDFRKLLESEPKLALAMLETLAERLAHSAS